MPSPDKVLLLCLHLLAFALLEQIFSGPDTNGAAGGDDDDFADLSVEEEASGDLFQGEQEELHVPGTTAQLAEDQHVKRPHKKASFCSQGHLSVRLKYVGTSAY